MLDPDDREEPELVVPARATVGGHGPRMAERIATLAEFQDGPESTILAGMQLADSDVIRPRSVPRPAIFVCARRSRDLPTETVPAAFGGPPDDRDDARQRRREQ